MDNMVIVNNRDKVKYNRTANKLEVGYIPLLKIMIKDQFKSYSEGKTTFSNFFKLDIRGAAISIRKSIQF